MPAVQWHPSPNFGARKGGATPSLVLLHYTAMQSCEKARDWLSNPEAGVSAHYVIGRQGDIWHLVREEDRAWHAGVGTWGGQGDINSRSIGIELSNDGSAPFSEPLMAALEGLLAGILQRWNIPPKGVVGHSDTALGRKIDPGPRFDWLRLAKQGLAIWPEPVDEQDFGSDLKTFGYDPDVDNATVLHALRARFRNGYDGPVDAQDRQIAACLAQRWPAA